MKLREPRLRTVVAQRSPRPFVVVVVLGVVFAALGGVEAWGAMVIAAVLTALVTASAFIVSPSKPPGWWSTAAPLACIAIVALLVEARGGAASGLGPLMLVPVVWLALDGSRTKLLAGLAALAVAFAVPLAFVGEPRYPAAEWHRMILALTVAAVVGLTIQSLVRALHRGAAAGDALKWAIVETSLDCVVVMDHRGCVVEFNPAAERTFGYSRSDAVGSELASLLVPAELREAHRQGLERYLATGQGQIMDRRLEMIATRADGEAIPVELTITRIPDVEPPMFAGSIRDLTERRRAERDIAAQHGVARVLAESASVDEAMPALLEALGTSMAWEMAAGWLVDEQTSLLCCDNVWEAPGVDVGQFRDTTLGLAIAHGSGPLGRVWASGETLSTDDAAGQPGYHRVEAAQRAGLLAALWVPIRSGPEVVGVLEFYSRRPNPMDDTLLATVSAVGSRIGEFFSRRRAEQRLAHQALHDGLTGLPNRELLLDRLGHALVRARRSDDLVAVLFLDLDDFKIVNDSFGHQVGDRLLIAVADQLCTTLRSSDSVGRLSTSAARLGGDEFVIVCEGLTSEHDAIRVAERISADITRSFIVNGHEIAIAASVGVALAADQDTDRDALLRDADAAMYRAKARGGRGVYEIFSRASRPEEA